MISEGQADSRFCFLEGTNTTATVRNTEKITIFAAPGQVGGGYQFDQSDGRFAPERRPRPTATRRSRSRSSPPGRPLSCG